MTLTEWIPCTTAPVREGWYDLERRLTDGSVVHPAERVRFSNGDWDFEASASGLWVWKYADHWRGVTRESVECSGKKSCTADSCMWPQCKPNGLLQKLRGVTRPEGE